IRISKSEKNSNEEIQRPKMVSVIRIRPFVFVSDFGFRISCFLLLSPLLLFFPADQAGDGNRTHVSSLEGYGSTIELHPRTLIWLMEGEGFEPSKALPSDLQS